MAQERERWFTTRDSAIAWLKSMGICPESTMHGESDIQWRSRTGRVFWLWEYEHRVEFGERLTTRVEWEVPDLTNCCPECGSLRSMKDAYAETARHCMKCGQEWFTDIKYVG